MQILPERKDRFRRRRSPFRQGQNADHLREVGVGGGADQQAAGLAAVFVGVAAQPGPRSLARPQRVGAQVCRFVERPRFAALAANAQVGEVAGGATFVQPKLAVAAQARAMHEPAPIQIICMAPLAGSHETGGHDGLALEALPVVQSLAMHQPPGALALAELGLFLHDEPFRKAPGADASGRPPGFPWRWGRRVKPQVGQASHGLQLAGEARLRHFLQIVRPAVQAADDGGLPRQVDQGARTVGGDDLALPKLPDLAAHGAACPRESSRCRLTSGSTSRRERLARNLRWSADSKSASSISRSSGRDWLSSCLWYCTETLLLW